MTAAHHALAAEIASTEHLDRALNSNSHILRASIAACDDLMANSAAMPAALEPPIDDVLVAPTIAQNQLWALEADVAAIREALWCLLRAVGAGRVGCESFVKLNRGLAREMFLKMALARKVARGLGLDLAEAGFGNGGNSGTTTTGGGSGNRRGGDGEGFYS